MHFGETEFPHPAKRRRENVVMTSLCTPQRRRRYVSNETPNDVSMKLHQDVSVVRIHDILLECRDNVSRGHNNAVSSVRLYDVSEKSQMKHPTTKHQTSNIHLIGTSPRCLNGTYPRRPISKSLRHLL